ncbi:translocation/assembly module TamB domain-containing protein [Sandaracinobacteroides saxicola]|uniref:Translocation/assembly module TamB domain-containing protein n=1 Tax=Sandaracinobacteroides saxicola TaxID=2759707 RepID=A0A7G5IJX8_9SPHN|nr:translocation/assembly module TamB domain-containing protein [Sandaracinobacteroides saxicola]QMW23670.1 translocation/assembly module TamB domain-containing protein [Sandaracinobacteroides saxicola]
MRWLRRLFFGVIGLTLVAALAVWLAISALDTPRGRAWLADRIAAAAPESGLKVRIGRIEGSLFRALTLHDLVLSDPRGVWLTAPAVALEWDPAALLQNALRLRSLRAAEIRVWRRPQLRTDPNAPLFPNLDIFVGKLRIARLDVGPPADRLPALAVSGSADLRAGRALLKLDTNASDGGDRLLVDIDVEPARDRFQTSARLSSSGNGPLSRLIDVRLPLDLALAGSGRWSSWVGRIVATSRAVPLADLSISARDGRFRLSGEAAPAPLLSGAPARLSAPGLRLDATLTVTPERYVADLAVRSGVARLTAQGSLDRADSALAAQGLLRVTDPAALIRRMTGGPLTAPFTLTGPARNAQLRFTLAAPRLALGSTGFETVTGRGSLRLGQRPLTIPARLEARQISGTGADLAPFFTNFVLEAPLIVQNGALTSTALRARTDRATAQGSGRISLVDGDYSVAFTPLIPRYDIPDIGAARIQGRLLARPDPLERGVRLTGPVTATIARLDPGFFNWLLEGPTSLSGTLFWPPTSLLRLDSLRLASPGLNLSGSATRFDGGRVVAVTAGRSRRFGSTRLALDGPLTRPRLDIALADPGLASRDLAATLLPNPDGWSVTATATSPLGPATATGALLLTPQGALADIARLNMADTSASGRLALGDGLARGTLGVAGALAGSVRFDADAGEQRITPALTLAGGLDTPFATISGSGSLGGSLTLDASNRPRGSLDIALQRALVGRVPVRNASLALRLAPGNNNARLLATGTDNRFALDLSASADDDRARISGSGSLAGQAIRLEAPLTARRNDSVWTLDPAALRIGDGSLTLAGSASQSGWRADLAASALPLTALQLAGRASGAVALSGSGSGLPAARGTLRIAGLGALGQPALDAALGFDGTREALAVRLVAARQGVVIGRGQALINAARSLADSRLTANLRWNGPAETLWPLVGSEAVQLTGPVALSLDATGTLARPDTRGTVGSSALRAEIPALGLAATELALAGRFEGDQLRLDRLAGRIGGGSVSGGGSLGLASAEGFASTVNLRLDRAPLLARDDFRATGSGTLTLSYGPRGGRIGGALAIANARIRFGRPSATELTPIVIIDPDQVEPPPAPETNWALALTLDAPGAVRVAGLGLDSEWRGTLRVGGTASRPVLEGRAQLVSGAYDFAGKRFDIRRGEIRFNGSNPPDPALDIVAESSAQGLTATLRISGTAEKPQIAFSSLPSLPEDEILARLLFGSSISTLSAPEAVQLAGALATLRQGGQGALNPVNTVRRIVGIDRLRILPADTAIRRKTAVAAGQYVGRRVYVEVASDAAGYTATQVQVALSRSLSILSQVSTIGGSSVNVRWTRDY